VLGVTLFERTTRNLNITDAGEILLENAYLILNTVNKIADNIALNKAGVNGYIRVGAILSAYAIVLPTVVQRFKEKYPNVNIELVEASADAIHTMLNTNKIDFAICDQNFESDGYEYHHLYYDNLMLVTHNLHPLAKRDECDWQSIKAEPFISMSGNTNIRPLTEKFFLANGAKLTPVYNAEFQSTTLSLIKQNLGVSILPQSTQQLMNCDGVFFTTIAAPMMHNSIGILSKTNKGTIKVAASNFIAEIDRFVQHNIDQLF
jgi:DNA-binding transcriptional LysR family regulator